LDISIVTVTYNERENIGLLIDSIEKEFKEHKLKGEIIVVDDNSPDGTGNIVLKKNKKYKNINLISRMSKLGVGSAYFAGVKAAQGEVIITMDADLSHPPDRIFEMYCYAKDDYVVSGSRYIERMSFKTMYFRWVGTTTINTWLRFLLRLGIKDHTNGYLAIKASILDKVLMFGMKYNIRPFDLVLYGLPIFTLSKKLGYKLKEVSAPYTFRIHGETKIDIPLGFMIMVHTWLYSIKLFFETLI